MSRWVDLDNGMHHLIGVYCDHEMWSINPDAVIGSREEEEQDTAAAYFSGYIKGHAGKWMERKKCYLECLRCKQTYDYSWDTMDEISYTMYSYCPDCIRKGIQLLKSQDKKGDK